MSQQFYPHQQHIRALRTMPRQLPSSTPFAFYMHPSYEGRLNDNPPSWQNKTEFYNQIMPFDQFESRMKSADNLWMEDVANHRGIPKTIPKKLFDPAYITIYPMLLHAWFSRDMYYLLEQQANAISLVGQWQQGETIWDRFNNYAIINVFVQVIFYSGLRSDVEKLIQDYIAIDSSKTNWLKTVYNAVSEVLLQIIPDSIWKEVRRRGLPQYLNYQELTKKLEVPLVAKLTKEQRDQLANEDESRLNRCAICYANSKESPLYELCCSSRRSPLRLGGGGVGADQQQVQHSTFACERCLSQTMSAAFGNNRPRVMMAKDKPLFNAPDLKDDQSPFMAEPIICTRCLGKVDYILPDKKSTATATQEMEVETDEDFRKAVNADLIARKKPPRQSRNRKPLTPETHSSRARLLQDAMDSVTLRDDRSGFDQDPQLP